MKNWKIGNGKLQCDINKEAAKILALSSAKIYKYAFLYAKKDFLLSKVE